MKAFIATMQKNRFKVAAFAAIVLVAAAFVCVIAMNIMSNFFSDYSPDSKGIGFFYILIPAFIFIIVVLTAIAISVAIRGK
jgi:multisubunit Na+/H+ antiporter MnhB subunit